MTSSLPPRVLRARLQLMLQHPYLASACVRFPLTLASEAEGVSTLATDGYRIYVNPDFVTGLSEEELLGTLAHELLHNVLGHLERRGTRDPVCWNEAIDHATNLMLEDLGFTLPQPRLSHPRHRGKSAEAIYQFLQDNGPAYPNQRNWDVHLPSLQGPPRLDPLPTPWEQQRLQQRLHRELQQEFRRYFGDPLPGRLSGTWGVELSRAKEAQVPWQSVLAHFISGLRRSDYRTFPFNKKHLWRGMGLPSLGVPGPELLVVAVDTSGSMSDALLRQILAEVDQLRTLSGGALTLLECDNTLQRVTTWEAWETNTPALQHWTFQGRGGTCFEPVFRWLEDASSSGGNPPDALIYLTDGWAPFPPHPPQMVPLLWGVPEGQQPPEAFPYGEVLRLPQTP